jgi:Asp-tRNA(Asn)/Glu-tRNA(Gln) amidotransferase A subunit family amidase
MSTVHALSRSVRDSAALLDATAGPDVGAPYWAEPPSRPWLAEVGADPGRLRIAIQTRAWNGAPVDRECVSAAEDAAKLCASLGHEVSAADLAIDAEVLGDATRIVIGANVRATVEDRAKALGRAFTHDDLEPVTYGMVIRAQEAHAAAYARAIRVIHAVGRQVARFFQRFDVLLTPTMATPPLPIGRLALDRADVPAYLEDLNRTVGFTSLFNTAGNPAMSVPLAQSKTGLPIGVQFAARYADEATLFRLAGQLEAARPWKDRRPRV